MKRSHRIRPIARLAWRSARISIWRSVLVVLMVALPIAGLVGAGITIQTATPSDAERIRGALGTADLAVVGWHEELTAETLRANLPAGTGLYVQQGTSRTFVGAGMLHYVTLEQIPATGLRGTPVAAMYRMVSGAEPTKPGEVAIDRGTARDLGLAVGDEWVLTDPELRMRITGMVVRPEALNARVSLVAPGTVDETYPFSYLLTAPAGMKVETLRARVEAFDKVQGVHGGEDILRGSQATRRVMTVAAFAVTAVALMGTGLIAAAAFVVGARRQLRTLGLVVAAGGETAQAGSIVLAGGVVLGLAGSVLGVVLGVIGSAVALPRLPDLIGRLPGPPEIPPVVIIGAIALGTLAAAGAAWGPARTAARVAPVDALAGRMPAPKPAGKLARRGVLAAVAGGAIVAYGTTRADGAILAVGLTAMLGGFLFMTPLLIGIVARIASRFPAAIRLAARDAARHGRRTSAAVAAAVIALIAPIAASAITLSDEAAQRAEPSMADDHLTISRIVSTDGEGSAGPDALVAELQRALPGSITAGIAYGGLDPDRFGLMEEGGWWSAHAEGPTKKVNENTYETIGGPLVIGDADLMRALHAESAVETLRRDGLIALGLGTTDNGVIRIRLPDAQDGSVRTLDLKATEVAVPRFSADLPGYVISPERAKQVGIVAGLPWTVLMRAPSALTGDQVAQVHRLAERYDGAYVTTLRDLQPSAAGARWALTGGAALLALAVVGVAVALVSAESRRDAAILAAIGASPRSRRRIAGANAGMLAALAGIVAVPAGFLPVAIAQVFRSAEYPIVVPWSAIAIVVLAVPAIAAIVAASVARQPKPAMMLRPVA